MKQKVYLAGGFKTGWQERLISTVGEDTFLWLDPSAHGIEDPALYTFWDLNAIKDSDVVFAYLEHSNPAGYALCLEIGYALALGKTVILVDEKKSVFGAYSEKYMDMARHAATIAFTNLSQGVEFLKNLA